MLIFHEYELMFFYKCFSDSVDLRTKRRAFDLVMAGKRIQEEKIILQREMNQHWRSLGNRADSLKELSCLVSRATTELMFLTCITFMYTSKTGDHFTNTGFLITFKIHLGALLRKGWLVYSAWSKRNGTSSQKWWLTRDTATYKCWLQQREHRWSTPRTLLMTTRTMTLTFRMMHFKRWLCFDYLPNYF